MVAATILLTEWRLRDTPHVQIPVYPVDLRFVLAPQWPRRSYQSGVPREIGPNTDIVDPGKRIVATLRADLANGDSAVGNTGAAFGLLRPTTCLLH